MMRPGIFSLAVVVLIIASARASADGRAAERDPEKKTDTIEQIRDLPPRAIDEVVWLARCIYSESNRSHEQRLVA